jgi:hypothetical protein
VRVVSQERLGTIVSTLPGVPRVVAGGTKVPGVADLKPYQYLPSIADS